MRPVTPSCTTKRTPPDIGRDDRARCGQGFDQRNRRALAGAREHDDIEIAHRAGHIIRPAEEVDAALQAEHCDPLLEASARRPSPMRATWTSGIRAAASRSSSMFLTGTRRPTAPINGTEVRRPSRRRTTPDGSVMDRKRVRSRPSGTTRYWSGRPMPRSSRSSRTCGLTAMSRSVPRARRRSTSTKRPLLRRWKVRHPGRARGRCGPTPVAVLGGTCRPIGRPHRPWPCACGRGPGRPAARAAGPTRRPGCRTLGSIERVSGRWWTGQSERSSSPSWTAGVRGENRRELVAEQSRQQQRLLCRSSDVQPCDESQHRRCGDVATSLHDAGTLPA